MNRHENKVLKDINTCKTKSLYINDEEWPSYCMEFCQSVLSQQAEEIQTQ